LRYRCAPTGSIASVYQNASVVQKYVRGVLDICRIWLKADSLMCPNRDTCAKPTPNNCAHLVRPRCAKLCGGVLRTFDKTRENQLWLAASRTSARCAAVPALRTSLRALRSLNAPPEKSFAPPPGRNSVNFAPPARTNLQSINDLRAPRGAKRAEFRPTRKRKNIAQAKKKNLHPGLRKRTQQGGHRKE
jgi:hypothetical protein